MEVKLLLDHDAVEIVPLGEVTADRYSRIVLQLKKDGSPIPINDVWIASQAVEGQLSEFLRSWQTVHRQLA